MLLYRCNDLLLCDCNNNISHSKLISHMPFMVFVLTINLVLITHTGFVSEVDAIPAVIAEAICNIQSFPG